MDQMVIIIIRRCVRLDKEAEFLANYERDAPKHEDFLGETLTKIGAAIGGLPEPMRSLHIPCAGNCVTYVNVAKWKSAESFYKHFKPLTMHDPDTEVSDRHRIVLEVVVER